MADPTALFSENGIELTVAQIAQLTAYIRLLDAENARQNLTAVRDEDEIWVRHILDAAFLLRYLPRGEARLIDIGTGGGIPGIPLAILRPDLQVTLLDSELRKIEFCADTIKTLHLDAKAVCGRAEELAHKDAFRGRFDIAVSRAMASGSMLCELAIPMLKMGGTLFAMKGRSYDPAAERFGEACAALEGVVISDESYTLCGEQKHIIICPEFYILSAFRSSVPG